jgi:Second Messenger Oligonucleotide or Dinucleotide Synthetase domain
MLDIAPVSSVPQLDDLLNRIGAKLQISETAYNLANDRYHTISNWLNDEKSPLSKYKPRIYAQGSLNLGTTTKPVGRAEYDLDFVCEFQMKSEDCLDPLILLDLIENRLNEHDTYKNMIERLNRCIRVTYANDFHVDILPACPNPKEGAFGATCVLVPDSKARCFKDSNPLGYAEWFKQTAERAVISFRAHDVKPLPEQQVYEDLTTLQRVVQLMKRSRDILLKDLDEKERPISIVLTTLAAQMYRGQTSVTTALIAVLDSIIQAISQTETRLVVLNPTNTNEDLSERWENNHKLYQNFVDWVYDFREKMQELVDVRGIYRVEEKLKAMFGENLASRVVSDYAEFIDEERRNGTLGVAKGSGLIVSTVSSVSAVTPIKTNTFHGRE